MVINRNFKHLKRYREIIMVFVKHGFGFVFDQLGVLKYLSISRKEVKSARSFRHERLTTGQRLRFAFEELGATFIKIGQILSTRPDILPGDIIAELEKLQNKVPPFEFEEVSGQIEKEFLDTPENLFLSIDENPLAAGSIAQVHRSVLKSGAEVVLKVQRPGIREIFESDIRILEDLADFLDTHTKLGKLYRFKEMTEEFKIILFKELDFTIEAQNSETFNKNFLKDKNIYFPQINWESTGSKVLTMEYIPGVLLKNIHLMKDSEIDYTSTAKIITTAILNQILRDGFYHADPHPGNIMITPEGKIAFIDLGMVGRLSDERKKFFLKIFLGIVFKSSRLIANSLIEQSVFMDSPNIKKFQKDIDIFCEKYFTIPVKEIKIGEAFYELFAISFRYKIKIPREVSIIAKTLFITEASIEKLDPELSIIEIAEPIAKKLIFRSFSTDKIVKDSITSALEYSKVIKEFPSFLLNLFNKFQFENFTINFKLEDSESILNRLDKIFNRISLGIIILSTSIIIASIIIGSGLIARLGPESSIFNIYILKLSLSLGGIMVFLLILAIFRSGRF